MDDSLFSIVHKYTEFHINGKRVQIPYCIVGNKVEPSNHPESGRTTKFSNYAGKGTAEQINQALIQSAKKENLDLSTKTSAEITRFMIEQGIGIDCSGFVYNVLNEYFKKTKHITLDEIIFRFPGIMGSVENLLFRNNRVRRCSAEVLTSDLNTIKISKVKDIQPGDMIRLTHPNWAGKHIAIIVEVSFDHIQYAHSSEYTQNKGPHTARINTLFPNEGLEKQEWLESTIEGNNYGKVAYIPERGDSIRRIKLYAPNSTH
jgi:hypothetical protein